MKATRPALIAVVALALATSACAVASDTSDRDAELPVVSVSGICAPEFPDCDDTVAIDEEDLFPNDEQHELKPSLKYFSHSTRNSSSLFKTFNNPTNSKYFNNSNKDTFILRFLFSYFNILHSSFFLY